MPTVFRDCHNKEAWDFQQETKDLFNESSDFQQEPRDLQNGEEIRELSTNRNPDLRHKTKQNVVLPSATDPKMWKNWVGFFSSFFFEEKRKKKKNVSFVGIIWV